MKCYNCGKQLDNSSKTREHIPAKALFRDFKIKLTDNIITVPACRECNKLFSKYTDEEFRNFIGSITDEFRKNKIRMYVKEADKPLGILTTYLDYNISNNLHGKLKNYKSKLRMYYFGITDDNGNSNFDKMSSLKEYYAELEKINTWEKEIKTYAELLQKIKKGHHELAKNVDKIKDDELKKHCSNMPAI